MSKKLKSLDHVEFFDLSFEIPVIDNHDEEIAAHYQQIAAHIRDEESWLVNLWDCVT